MQIFQNGVGRPSNELIKKRRTVYFFIAFAVILFIGAGALFIKKQFFDENEIGSKSKNAATSCAQPYNIAACENEGYYGRPHKYLIQKLQEMLKEAGYHYGYVNGNYGSYTVDAVKRAQRAFGLQQTGQADYQLVQKMAPRYGYGYTIITYNKNGGSGSIYGTKNNKQFLMRAYAPISSSKLSKTGATHIGWIATAVSRNNNSKVYYYGCSSKNCTKPVMYTESQKNNLGNKFVPYVFIPGENVHSDTFNELDGVFVNFSAYYCSATGATYNKKTSSCSKGTAGNGTSNVIGKYTAIFDLNGASVLSKTSETCDITTKNKASGCKVTLPSIIGKTGATVIGWSEKKNSTTAEYKVGSTVTLTGNKTFYAITKRKLTVTFNKNTAESIGATSKECYSYGASGCTVTTPTIKSKSGYYVLGWSKDPNGRKYSITSVNAKLNLTDNVNYYAITNNLLVKFPDEQLRKCVLYTYKKRYYNSQNVVDLTNEQLKAYTSLDCYYYSNINDTTGLKYLPNIEYLSFGAGKLQTIDLSSNTKLKRINLSGNMFKNLDLSKNIALTELDVSRNQFTKLDVSKNVNLQDLNVAENKLTSIDVSKNTKLLLFNLRKNPLTSINISKNTLLERLYVDETNLSKIDVRSNPKLKSLDINRTGISAVDITKNSKLVDLYASNCNLTSLNTSNNPDLGALYVEHNKITSLDLSKNAKLQYLEAANNKIKNITESPSPDLKRMVLNDNEISSINVKNNTKLEYFQIVKNKLTSLDVSKNTSLTWLSVGGNSLTSLNVSNALSLKYLEATVNKLTSINVTKNTKLESLDVAVNKLTNIDVSKNLELKELAVYSNKLTHLDVSKNTKLTKLRCGWNGLKTSDIKTGNNKNLIIENYN